MGELGQAIAHALVQVGARVVPLDDLDRSTGQTPAALLERAVVPFGRLDLLVTTPVTLPATTAESGPVKQFQTDITTNLSEVFFWCQAAAEQMKQQSPSGGCIITITSVGGVVALPGQAAFCAAMAGVNAMTQTLATEWQPHGIRVVSVGAGLSRELVDQVLPTVLPDGKTPGHRRMPEQTLTTPADVANVVTFVASDAGRHINGTTIYTDGGWLADGYWE
jgi:2-deoxy-D-gluconate 3-dehydrogenase